MSFALLEVEARNLTDLINKDLGWEVIKPMTLEIPQPPPDDLHFFKLVVWCYGYFFEAAADALKECKALMKQGAPERTNRFDAGARTVNNLRTYKVHNLPPSKGNNKKRQEAEAWLTGVDSELAIERLCEMALAMIRDAHSVWEAATQDTGDASQLFKRVTDTLQNAWAAHELHELANGVAGEISLKGFDAKAFCEPHLEAWRRVGGCFLDRESGAAGVTRAIRKTMHHTFGI